MQNRLRNAFVVCFICLVMVINAQIMTTGNPVIIPRLRSLTPSINPVYVLPKFDIEKEQKSSDSLYLSERRFTFGKSFDVNISPRNSGEWFQLANGDSIWELEIYSESAYSLNLIFSSFHLPEGAKLYIFNAERSSVIGAFTSLNNKPTGVLPTLPVAGERITVQYIQPPNVTFSGDFKISTITHDFLNVFNVLRSGYYGDAGSCELNVSCYDKYIKVKQSVVKIIVGGAELCSGALINNTLNDGMPYVLTAKHCLSKDTTGYKCLFIFNYESPRCMNYVEGNRSQSLAGAEVKAISFDEIGKDIDFALLKASVPIPAIYKPYFAGWNVTSVLPTNTFVIHHPVGDVKKVSWDNDSPLSTTLTIDTKRYFPYAHYRVIRWEGGITEGGSSGSPLFNQEYKIVGALSAGASSCSNAANDYFYKMSYAWRTWSDDFRQLKHWLDPNGSGALSLNGFEPKDAAAITRFSNIVDNDSLGVTYKDGVLSSVWSNVDAIAEHFYISSGKLLGIYFVPYKGWSTQANPVSINIWSGEGEPDELLYTQQLSLSEWGRSQTVSAANYGQTGGFVTSDKLYNSTSKKECFVALANPVAVKDGFFISFTWDQLVDTFALIQTIKRDISSVATAWQFDGGIWSQVANSDIDNSPVSFFVEALLTDVEDNVGIKTISTSDLNLKYDRKSGILSVVGDDNILYNGVASLYDMQGCLLGSIVLNSINGYNITDIKNFMKDSNLYILTIGSNSATKSFKISLPMLQNTSSVFYL